MGPDQRPGFHRFKRWNDGEGHGGSPESIALLFRGSLLGDGESSWLTREHDAVNIEVFKHVSILLKPWEWANS